MCAASSGTSPPIPHVNQEATHASQALDPPPAPGQRCEIGAALHAVVVGVSEMQTGFESSHGLASRCAVRKSTCDCRHRRHTAFQRMQ